MNSRINLFGVEIDRVRMSDAVERVMDWVAESNSGCRYVVTPNVDHTVMLQENETFRDAYSQADLVTADGHPVVLASRLLGQALPERVTGADLVPGLFDAADKLRPLRVFLLGAGPGIADRAARNIHGKWSGVQVVGTYSPPMGFENDDQENDKILDRIAQTSPDILVVGLGAPKQELWVHEHRDRMQAKVALCVGATIDFLANHKPRAPRWMQRVGLEWFHRMVSEPRRLVKRYARDAWIFPQLVWRQWWARPARIA